jgi:hypothetical protein
MTWQATEKNKVGGYFELQPHVNHQNGTAAANPSNTVSIEAATYTPHNPNLAVAAHLEVAVQHQGVPRGRHEPQAQRHITRNWSASPCTWLRIQSRRSIAEGSSPGCSFEPRAAGTARVPAIPSPIEPPRPTYRAGMTPRLASPLKRGKVVSVPRAEPGRVYILNNGVPRSFRKTRPPTDHGQPAQRGSRPCLSRISGDWDGRRSTPACATTT